jgi:hypothetical protein
VLFVLLCNSFVFIFLLFLSLSLSSRSIGRRRRIVVVRNCYDVDMNKMSNQQQKNSTTIPYTPTMPQTPLATPIASQQASRGASGDRFARQNQAAGGKQQQQTQDQTKENLSNIGKLFK